MCSHFTTYGKQTVHILKTYGIMEASEKGMAPQVLEHPGARPTDREGGPVDTNRVPQAQHDDDTVEAHYACLESPHACIDGWVFVGYIDEGGEEREAAYPCRRCADSLR
jgi:hypothetical protein